MTTLALGGLPQMYDSEKHLFCYGAKRNGVALVNYGLSRTNTLITLIGIRKAELAGNPPPIEMAPAIENLRNKASQFDKLGDLGLFLWLSSMSDNATPPAFPAPAALETALHHHVDAIELRTMELAWFLAGVSELATRSDLHPSETRVLQKLATETYQRLCNNQEETGLFLHSSPRHSVSGRVRSRIASFADQIYPIYALSRYSAVFDVESGTQAALSCAEKLCALQGPCGQWWWHYDAVDGRVIGRYPVYSVHQDGMAPMAFFALMRASGKNYAEPIIHGLNWIFGNNELNTDLRNEHMSVIWRNIHQSKTVRYVEEARAFINSGAVIRPATGLNVLYECHPYHLGWLLFALSDPTAESLLATP